MATNRGDQGQWASKTVEVLKIELKRRGLTKQGRKSDLIQRLLDYDRMNPHAPAVATPSVATPSRSLANTPSQNSAQVSTPSMSHIPQAVLKTSTALSLAIPSSGITMSSSTQQYAMLPNSGVSQNLQALNGVRGPVYAAPPPPFNLYIPASKRKFTGPEMHGVDPFASKRPKEINITPNSSPQQKVIETESGKFKFGDLEFNSIQEMDAHSERSPYNHDFVVAFHRFLNKRIEFTIIENAEAWYHMPVKDADNTLKIIGINIVRCQQQAKNVIESRWSSGIGRKACNFFFNHEIYAEHHVILLLKQLAIKFDVQQAVSRINMEILKRRYGAVLSMTTIVAPAAAEAVGVKNLTSEDIKSAFKNLDKEVTFVPLEALPLACKLKYNEIGLLEADKGSEKKAKS